MSDEQREEMASRESGLSKAPAVELLKRFPDMPLRENCLEDIACPKCGQRDEFVIKAAIHMGLTDDGTDAYSDSTKNFTEIEYDEKNYIFCPDCNHEGTVGGFTHQGLDELIESREPEPEGDNATPCPECGATAEHYMTCSRREL